MKHPAPWLPRVTVAVTITCFALLAWPRSDRKDDWHYRELGRLPVVQEGRIMPLDTVARLALMSVSHRQTLYVGRVDNDERERDQKSFPAIKWLADTMAAANQDARLYLPVFEVSPRLQRALALPEPRARYAIHDLAPSVRTIIGPEKQPADPEVRALLGQLQDFMQAHADSPVFEYRIFRIEDDRVRHTLGLELRPGLRYSFLEVVKEAKTLEDEMKRIHMIKPSARNLFDVNLAALHQHLQTFVQLTGWRGPLSIPPGDGSERWCSLSSELEEPTLQHRLSILGKISYLELLAAYHVGTRAANKSDRAEIERFNKIIASYHAELDKALPDAMRGVRLEAWFNEFQPFYYCAIFYALIVLGGCLSWLVWFRTLNRAAYGAMLVVFTVHTIALLSRMYIQGRPPVTNLYSSAIFVGWGCVLTCLVLEFICPYSLALIVGSVTGALSLVVAHFLSLDGDTLGMLQAVLDTNFWLATHVVCMTLGCMATFVAGFMGVAYILVGLFTPLLSRDVKDIFPAEAGAAGRPSRGGQFGTMLARMTYGVVCCALLLSFTGTVLGGIWGDQSWGRFWGWDPKENGALMIVIWNALVLHARWGGMIKQRGLAVLAVFGNVVTAWSWFGTNLLGIGLHAYGFIKGAMLGLVLFDASQLAIIALGLIPLSLWRSFRKGAASSLKQGPEPAGVDHAMLQGELAAATITPRVNAVSDVLAERTRKL